MILYINLVMLTLIFYSKFEQSVRQSYTIYMHCFAIPNSDTMNAIGLGISG